ncbi:hypothetical protein Bca52824_011331 [Brassica carinata]|uniref:Uncharacterized protein n=1 Tax=Brassica carinata TaxID=52824 RepID=A0A8X7WHV6_BRACI|nr:hypothetical protein Bca52824_011331 [Brassica carinata]
MNVSTFVGVIKLVAISRSIRLISSPPLLPMGGGRFSIVGRAPGEIVPSGLWPEESLSARAARSLGVSKSSLLPLRAFVAPRGTLLLAFSVKVSTCFAREATSFPCLSDFF